MKSERWTYISLIQPVFCKPVSQSRTIVPYVTLL